MIESSANPSRGVGKFVHHLSKWTFVSIGFRGWDDWRNKFDPLIRNVIHPFPDAAGCKLQLYARCGSITDQQICQSPSLTFVVFLTVWWHQTKKLYTKSFVWHYLNTEPDMSPSSNRNDMSYSWVDSWGTRASPQFLERGESNLIFSQFLSFPIWSPFQLRQHRIMECLWL